MTEDASLETSEIRNEITSTIRKLISEWIAEGEVKNVYQIGSGQCYEFADELEYRLQKIPGVNRAETEDWWIDDFSMDIGLLRRQCVELPKNINDNDLSYILGAATHAWITWNGLHFDATAPEGVACFTQMPFFADQISAFQQAAIQA